MASSQLSKIRQIFVQTVLAAFAVPAAVGDVNALRAGVVGAVAAGAAAIWNEVVLPFLRRFQKAAAGE